MRRSLGPLFFLLLIHSVIGLTLLSNGLKGRYHHCPTRTFLNGRACLSSASLSSQTRIYSSAGSIDSSSGEGREERSTDDLFAGTRTAKYRIPRVVSQSHFLIE
jgi:hypothetical protein